MNSFTFPTALSRTITLLAAAAQRRTMPRGLRALACGGLAALAMLAGCSAYRPGGLDIDHSKQAVSQNSRVEFIVLHYTSASNETSLKILTERNVSSHYLITNHPTPRVYQLVDESRRAWHAGVSAWYNSSNLNSASIGIEIVNPGPEGDTWAPYPTQQIQVLATLIKDIMARHEIKPFNVVGHSDIAPQRKLDPGPLFPWKALAQQGIGRWYDENFAQRFLTEFAAQGLPDMVWVQKELRRVGYAAPETGMLDKATRNVLAAFQMHYRPQLYDGNPDAETLAILKALR